MKWINILLAVATALLMSARDLTAAKASGDSYSQMIITFPGERPFTWDWNKKDGTLSFRFPKTSPDELDALNNYDDRLVRRVMFKDLGPHGSEVRLTLRDRNVQAVVTSFKDPFRISIDLFDKGYSESKDPETGLPLTAAAEGDPNKANAYEWLEGGTPEATTKRAEGGTKAKRRLLQALPEEINSPNELKAELGKVDPGVGKAWSTFPPYIYRMQLAPYEGREAPSSETSPLQVKAVTTSTAMADYASRLYDFGHEGRAMIAYQQVLRHEPEIFERDAVHLWKFAETHLGQGNLTLAEGYYQTLLEKHPDHIMARFAKLRKLDIIALRSLDEGNPERLKKLRDEALSISTRDNGELTAMIMIRDVWWGDTTIDQKSRNALPVCDEEAELNLNKVAPRIENPKTAYLAAALIAKRRTNKDTPWQNGYAVWLSQFFDRYKSGTAAAGRDSLATAAKERISRQFHELFKGGQFHEVVALYESLPKDSRGVTAEPAISRAIAESYRALGQNATAIPFYAQATKTQDVTDSFQAHFWNAKLAVAVVSDLKTRAGNQERIRSLESESRRSDTAMGDLWKKFKSDEKSTILTGLGQPLQEIVASDAKLRTPPRILLEQYKTSLTANAPKVNATSGTSKTDWAGNFSPSSSMVRQLDDLGRKFAELGMTNERRSALELMRFLKPTLFEQDKEAAKLWASELTKLADEHRKADEFLAAGELYTLVGDASVLTEQRAEALYKGGLLLFRAGKKQDAIKALEKAKADTSNLFYSKLATERLNQIDTK
jgi:tetratricopeptide (TPR) repeat protein